MRAVVRADSQVNAILTGRAAFAIRLALCLLLAVMLAGHAFGQTPAAERSVPGSGAAAAEHQQPGEGQPAQRHEASEASRQLVYGEPFWKAIARLFNFAVLVGVLVYFLRAPIAGYLARRSTEIRSDLVAAAETRQAAEADLAAIEQKMKALPGEIEALKARGAAEIAAEEARIRAAAEGERARLLEQARREIELQLRSAERDLLKRAAELTVGLASDRIKRTITDEDQKRLVDQHLARMPK